jgi:serine phosphatase RsbU (regulator of sigma subunit)
VCAPLLSGEDVVGVLVLAWDQSRAVHPLELATISTVAGYTAQALQRSTVVEHATTVARELQSALLSDLPAVPGLQMAARYLPADVGEFIGGDWYDAVLVPSDHAPDHREVALSVGDVVGHGIQASASMGQVRAMLRQASWEHAARGPAASLASLENAVAGLDLGVRGSAVLAHLRRLDEGAWRLTWSNAGHPPPLLLQPDGSVSVLAEHDMLLGYPALRPRPRRDHQVRVEPGATLLLYTDGLIERRDADLDQGLAQLCERLAGLHGTPPEAALDALVGALGAQTPKDDTVLLAVQTDRRSRGHAGRATNRA